MDAAWRDHLEALRRFNAWEDRQLATLGQDYREALAWMADAWTLAKSRNRDWCSGAEDEAYVRHLIGIRDRLARANLQS